MAIQLRNAKSLRKRLKGSSNEDKKGIMLGAITNSLACKHNRISIPDEMEKILKSKPSLVG